MLSYVTLNDINVLFLSHVELFLLVDKVKKLQQICLLSFPGKTPVHSDSSAEEKAHGHHSVRKIKTQKSSPVDPTRPSPFICLHLKALWKFFSSCALSWSHPGPAGNRKTKL